MIVGTVLAFARSLGEFGATITFVSNIPDETRTLPLAMFTLIETPGAERAAVRHCHRAGAALAANLRMAGALGTPQDGRLMLTLNFSQRLGAYQLDIDACIPAQGITAVFGRSGAGKTLLINAISGLTQP
nr:putative membrane protein YbhT [Candidatus Pantoea persica]